MNLRIGTRNRERLRDPLVSYIEEFHKNTKLCKVICKGLKVEMREGEVLTWHYETENLQRRH